MFRTLSQLVIRAPGLCIGLWIGIAVLTGLLAPSKEELRRSEPTTLLPDDSPFNRAMRYYAEAFPEQTARSRLVLVFQRPLSSAFRRERITLGGSIAPPAINGGAYIPGAPKPELGSRAPFPDHEPSESDEPVESADG